MTKHSCSINYSFILVGIEEKLSLNSRRQQGLTSHTSKQMFSETSIQWLYAKHKQFTKALSVKLSRRKLFEAIHNWASTSKNLNFTCFLKLLIPPGYTLSPTINNYDLLSIVAIRTTVFFLEGFEEKKWIWAADFNRD